MGKRIISVLLIVGICLSVTACSPLENLFDLSLIHILNREVYSKSKTAPTEEEREKFRKEYLDRRGIPENFRW